ncbi:DUF5320 domain-containing protein [Patescibacteria group bacterium]|nr:DUF5320 domain-containing protein [Patescibacteria group bacterium]MCL5091324.1 DUF5320 domain-containing protein [Patescibacteria group bacterium]
MPGFDETGPQGAGRFTGRGMGPCGRGLRRFFGRNRRWTKADLEDYRKELTAELKQVEKELLGVAQSE